MKLRFDLHSANARFYMGLALSLLLHGLILLFYLDRPPLPLTERGDEGVAPIEVRFLAPAPASQPAQRVVIAPPAPKPDKPVREKTTPPTARKSPRPAQKPSEPKTATTPPPAPVAERKFDPNMDMADMLQAARDRRKAAGIPEPESSQQAPQDDSAIARANVQELMDRQARGRTESGGVFQITHKGVRNAEFIFRGWSTQRNRNMRQLIQVDAGLGGDVDVAIARRMIEIIRQFERGDFTWESRRLGRVVTLSARLKDSADLEAFLIKEFM
ncbi:hypothetical protein [Oxalicibacterium faecigallinarum]|uniref:Uncharacterized protein n=1 Tax=Oxalicibacterium faecigallinarum TaxID=573741 RepID=A0A8J3F2M0_9BURK|nr:hypothetical protein [Oxalicibacterium faecigallinarum]GGI21608.1 hypothetical protein GCM10008066_29900 [Oxalicibacterium faecigallinarum]